MLAHQPPQIAHANGIDICYEIFGDPAAEPLLLIMGLGGGTGTGAAPVVAEICNRNNMMTFIIGINPFFFETEKIQVAREGLRTIRAACPNTITIENDKIFELMPNATMKEAMRAVNKSMISFVNETTAQVISGIEGEIASVRKNCGKKIDVSRMTEIKQPSWIKT
jgi:cell division protein FtsZ